jgi:hypothetical protein
MDYITGNLFFILNGKSVYFTAVNNGMIYRLILGAHISHGIINIFTFDATIYIMKFPNFSNMNSLFDIISCHYATYYGNQEIF